MFNKYDLVVTMKEIASQQLKRLQLISSIKCVCYYDNAQRLFALRAEEREREEKKETN